MLGAVQFVQHRSLQSGNLRKFSKDGKEEYRWQEKDKCPLSEK
nr:MAG TPA: hypothetical protein [Caudoviricetes sp.]